MVAAGGVTGGAGAFGGVDVGVTPVGGVATGDVVEAEVVAPVSAEVSMELDVPWLEQAELSVTKETRETSFRMKVSSGSGDSPLRSVRLPTGCASAFKGRVIPVSSRRFSVDGR